MYKSPMGRQSEQKLVGVKYENTPGSDLNESDLSSMRKTNVKDGTA